MKNWKTVYSSRLCTAQEAARHVKSGDRVLVAGATARPLYLLKALVDNAAEYRGVRIMHGLSYGGEDYCKEEYKENFIHESLFAGKDTREAITEGRAKFIPNYYNELGFWFSEGTVPINVFMVQTTPPDAFGFCSSGLNADFIQEAVDSADVVILQVNSHVPRNAGPDTLIHVSRATCIVEHDEPIYAVTRPKTGELEDRIGEYCASLVNDRDTIQIGLGAIPEAICKALRSKKDLGVHSELISDGIMDLWKRGVITNKYKSFDKGVMVAAFAIGTRNFYRMIDNNPAVVLRRAAIVNHPFKILKCANLVSINTCVEVDFMGQVVSGSAGLRTISGVGGQMDFVMGCALSRDKKARSIIAFTSTHTKNGVTTSRIKPLITHGSAVSVTRQDVDYVITEYGIAQLKGKTLKDRARALISIAHPDFRDELIEAYEKRFKVSF